MQSQKINELDFQIMLALSNNNNLTSIKDLTKILSEMGNRGIKYGKVYPRVQELIKKGILIKETEQLDNSVKNHIFDNISKNINEYF